MQVQQPERLYPSSYEAVSKRRACSCYAGNLSTTLFNPAKQIICCSCTLYIRCLESEVLEAVDTCLHYHQTVFSRLHSCYRNKCFALLEKYAPCTRLQQLWRPVGIQRGQVRCQHRIGRVTLESCYPSQLTLAVFATRDGH